jgi:choline dehydrogenase-like flavoprotein
MYYYSTITGGGLVMEVGKWDYIVVGSGAGGATVARELSKRKKKVLVIEGGPQTAKLGEALASTKFYDGNRLTIRMRHSREGVGIVRSLIAGGSTIISCGNGVRCLEKELHELGLNLDEEFAEVERELNVSPISPRLYSNGSKALIQAGKDLGYAMDPMPKFINNATCRKCGNCIFGCIHGAKWTSLNYLAEAVAEGCSVVYNTRVKNVVSQLGKAKGVFVNGPDGNREILGNAVILAAGGIGTPIILQNSGIPESGKKLFIDPLIVTYGITQDEKLSQVHEPSMTFVDLEFHKSRGFLLSTAAKNGGMMKYITYGLKGMFAPDNRTLAMMTKITDEAAGQVFPDGSISKPLTVQDRSRLKEGSDISKEIMAKAGAKRFGVSSVMGAHPGGTAAIGTVVDKNLQTKIDNLFVADASVLPVAPGLPPILTIVAIAKHLGRVLP